MDDALLISNFLLWIIVIALVVLVVALLRQIGILYERVAPTGALMLGGGPKVGDRAPELELETVQGEVVVLGKVRRDARSVLLFFLSPTCPICETLLPVLRSIRAAEGSWLDVVLASDGDIREHREFIRKKRLDDFPYVLSTELGMRLRVGRLPHAILLDDQGVIRAQGLTNTREHLESLFEAMERGVASMQEYMSRNRHQDVA
jgi:methylamine dehydrogenase accessory protein MauD